MHPDFHNNARRIHAHLKNHAKRVVIVPHQHPDGDAVGSARAFHEYLKNLGKEVLVYCVTDVAATLAFVMDATDLTHDEKVLTDPKTDTVIVLDSGDLRYAGIAAHLAESRPFIINIDHHATNEQYGNLNLVDTSAASTTEILYHFFRTNHTAINREMATALLTGLTTDTGNFTNAATSRSALAVGGELLSSGGNLSLITNATLRNKSVPALRLWGAVLGRLAQHETLNIMYTYMTREDVELHGVPDHESEGIANFLNNAEGVGLAVILKETEEGHVKGSMRTVRDDVDALVIAKALGGGGHKKAAGFTCPGPINTALAALFAEAEKQHSLKR